MWSLKRDVNHLSEVVFLIPKPGTQDSVSGVHQERKELCSHLVEGPSVLRYEVLFFTTEDFKSPVRVSKDNHT